jgi:hypothetical protein
MKIKHLNIVAIALLLGSALNGAAIARPLSEREQEVENQLQVAIEMSRGEGYQLVVPRNVAQLTRGADAPKTVLLSPNREYILLAVCDRNCAEIRLSVKDKKGNSIASNSSRDPVAVLNFQPPSEDRYQVTVKMEKCSVRACTFGLGIFAKR